MGPRSEDRGDVAGARGTHHHESGFNGSTVRGPW